MSAISTDSTASAAGRLWRRHRAVAAACGVFVAAMVGMSYAAVPLYDWFCRVTGFGGTTQVAAAAPGQVIDRRFEVRFDANVAAGLPWKFEAKETRVEVRGGEVATIFYTVVNASDRETVGTASFNVTPPQTGLYFNKIQCFCFTEQRLGPGERMEMPVVFFVDPAIDAESELKSVSSITLSYTFFATKKPGQPVAEGRSGDAARM